MEQQVAVESSVDIQVIEGALAEYAGECVRLGNGTGARARMAVDRDVEELGFRILGYIPSVPFDPDAAGVAISI